MRASYAVFAAALTAAVVAAGCGSDDGGDGAASGGGGRTLTIYSSLPLQGASKNQSAAIGNGMELALEQAGGKVGDYTVKYIPLDDSTAQAGAWTPEATTANARKAAQDDSAIAYLGEFNSGASAVSVPILNEVGLAQNGLTNTAVGLTTDEPGSNPGEPDKYYPAGERHYVRIVPKDTIQGAALVTLMKQDGCTKTFVTNDKEVFGSGLARNIELSAQEQGLELVGNTGIDKNAANYRSLAQGAASKSADCMVYAGITANNAVQLFKDFSAAMPDGKLYGPDGIAESGFADPKEGGIPAEVGAKVKVVIATLPAGEYPPEGQRFFEEYKSEYGESRPDPYAIYGYEAMSLTLDAIQRAAEQGEVDRASVVEQLFATKDRESVLGTYSIDENGDTTLTDYGAYSIEDGALVFGETIKAQPSAPAGSGRALPGRLRGRRELAFIGVGRMGGRMTIRLLDAGHAVTVFDPSQDAVASLVAHGARAAGSPAEAAAEAAFVLCSLPNPAILREAVAGVDGVLAGAAAARSSSTSAPAIPRGPRARERVARAGSGVPGRSRESRRGGSRERHPGSDGRGRGGDVGGRAPDPRRSRHGHRPRRGRRRRADDEALQQHADGDHHDRVG